MPLCLLGGLLLIVGGYVWLTVGDGGNTTFFNTYRVILLPASLVSLFAIWRFSASKSILDQMERNDWGRMVLWLSTGYFILLTTLKLLRLHTANYEIFDAGLYFNKIWRLNHMPVFEGIWVSLTEGHFQPINILFVLFVETDFIFEIAMSLETALFASGAVAIFKLTDLTLRNQVTAFSLSLAYLLNPQLQYNDILGYHPDFIVLPAILWGFYLLELRKPRAATLIFSLILTAGEPWIPLCGFVGFAMVLLRQYWREGLCLNLISIALFVLVFVFLLASTGSPNSAATVLSSDGNFKIVYQPSLTGFIEIISDKGKALFLYLIFLPFLFTPFLVPVALFMLVPEFAKAMLSNEPLHYAVEGHYTLAYIGIGYWALVKFMQRLSQAGIQVGKWLSGMALFGTLGISIGHGPLPYAYNFWADISGGAFNISKYTTFERRNDLRQALAVAGVELRHSVETDNSIFSPEIGRRQNLSLFPSEDVATTDFILIGKESALTSGSETSQAQYDIRYKDGLRILSGCFEKQEFRTVSIYRNTKSCEPNQHK